MSRGHVTGTLVAARLREGAAGLLTWTAAIAVVVGLLVCGTVTAGSIRSSFDASVGQLGAPSLLVTVLDGGGRDVRSVVADAEGIERVGPSFPATSGTAQGSGETALPALLVGALPADTHWSAPVAGTAGDTDAVAVERGYAQALGVRPGSRLEIGGPAGRAAVTVTATVRDLSRNSYPLTPRGAVYLGPSVAARIGMATDAPSTSTVTGLWTSRVDTASLGRAAGEVADRLGDAGLTPSVTALANTVDGIGFVARLSYGAVLLFGLVGLTCFAVYAAGDCRLDVLRRMRRLGALAAVGWTGGGLRRLLLLERLPALVVGGALGAVVGRLAGGALTGHLVEMAGATPVLDGVGASLAAVLAVMGAAVVVAVLRGSRQLGRARIAELLRGTALARPVRSRRSTPPVVGAARLGLEVLRSRPARTAGTGFLIALAAAAAVFSVSARATLDDATTRPSAWGFSYDYQVSLRPAADVAAVARAARSLDGVLEAREVVDSAVRLGDSGLMVPIRLLDAEQTVLTPHVLEGDMPARATEVAVGQGVARALGLAPGDALTLRAADARSLTVSGIVTELGSSGMIAYGTSALTSALPADAQRSVLVRTSGEPAAVAGLSRLDGGQAALMSAREQIALPFADTLRLLLMVLSVALAVLAVVIGASVTRAAAVEQIPNLALLTALGADARMRARSIGAVVGLLVVPSLLLGAVIGALGSPVLLHAATSDLGSLEVSTNVTTATLVVIGLAGVVLTAGAAPFVRAARRPPVLELRAGA